MKTAIGKNTLGGGKKMNVSLHNYNRSTHDLSTVTRTTMAPGVLVPTLKLLMLPGDTFDIGVRCHTLTHPTVGPLFGSFKQQNDFFFCPLRLYNAMLHNNTLNIGLDMGKVKLPIIQAKYVNITSDPMPGSNGTLQNHINPSALPAYLGIRSINQNVSGGSQYSSWNAIPFIAYYDIFKNYYANKQEEKFYTINGGNYIKYNTNFDVNSYAIFGATYRNTNSDWGIKEVLENPNTAIMSLPYNVEYQCFGIFIGQSLIDDIELDKITANINLISQYSNTIPLVTPGNVHGEVLLIENDSIQNLINKGILEEVTAAVEETKISTGKCYAFKETVMQGMDMNIYGYGNRETRLYDNQTQYNSYDLESIDLVREDILAAGRTQYVINDTSSDNCKYLKDIFKQIPYKDQNNIPACANPMVGLALKTYQSDINVNWVRTEWLDGDNGINAITAIDTSSGSFTIDQLNLATKVYTMLNRIAVSDGSYNAWIQTVYTSGGLNHIETPLYIGGSSLEIDFQEVINNSGSADEPL